MELTLKVRLQGSRKRNDPSRPLPFLIVSVRVKQVSPTFGFGFRQTPLLGSQTPLLGTYHPTDDPVTLSHPTFPTRLGPSR